MVLLRPLTKEDVAWIFDACQDVAIQRWTLVPRPYLLEHAAWFVENHPEYRVMVIEESESSRPLGVVSIHEVETNSREASIGYWIAPWGRGVRAASQGVELLIDAIEPGENIRSLVAYVAEENTASCRTVERAGFVEVEREWGKAREFTNETMAIKFRRTL